MKRTLLAAALRLSVPASAESTATLKSVDLYRSGALTVEAVQQRFGSSIESFARLRSMGSRAAQLESQKLKEKMEADLRRMAPLAWAEVSYGEYVTSAERTAYVTFDVVDAQDARLRMPFRAAPRDAVLDPEGLISSWGTYAGLGKKLIADGTLQATERPACLAFYCLWGSATPELGSYEKRFAQSARDDKRLLLRVARKDAVAQRRAAALYLLSYLPDGSEVAQIMTESLSDPSEDARGAALQVLSDIASYHKDVLLDTARIAAALDYPTISDRSKALAVLIGMVDNPNTKGEVLKLAAGPAARLLRLKQPSNRDLAFTLLSLLAPAPYGREDYDSWEKWAASASTGSVPSSGGPRR